MLTSIMEQLMNGLRTGSIYALIALGYTMVYGIAKMINFAHGDIIMVGAYTLYIGIALLHLPVIAAMILTAAVCSILGVLIEKVAYKPLRKAPPLAVLITAIGMSYFQQSVALLIFTSTPIPFRSVIDLEAVQVGQREYLRNHHRDPGGDHGDHGLPDPVHQQDQGRERHAGGL